MPARHYAPLRDRFLEKVDKSGGPDACWPWTGRGARSRGEGVYGRIKAGDVLHGAHRLAWEYANGPVPAGLFVLHRCDNPPCCNPAHLFVGTTGDNVRDMVSKGRHVNPKPFPSGERNPHAKLTKENVDDIRFLIGRHVTQAEIARRFGVSRTAISKIACGLRWRQVA